MKQVFPIAATGGLGTTAVVLGTTAVVLLVVIPLMLLAWYLNSVPRAVRFEVTPEGLRIRGDLLYGRSISRSDLSHCFLIRALRTVRRLCYSSPIHAGWCLFRCGRDIHCCSVLRSRNDC